MTPKRSFIGWAWDTMMSWRFWHSQFMAPLCWITLGKQDPPVHPVGNWASFHGTAKCITANQSEGCWTSTELIRGCHETATALYHLREANYVVACSGCSRWRSSTPLQCQWQTNRCHLVVFYAKVVLTICDKAGAELKKVTIKWREHFCKFRKMSEMKDGVVIRAKILP